MTLGMRLRQALRSRLLVRALLLNLSAVGVTVLVLGALYLWMGRTEFTRQLRSQAGALADFAAMESQFPMLVGDDVSLDRVAKSVLANEDVLFVVLSAAGRSEVVAAEPGISRREISSVTMTRIHARGGEVRVIDVERKVQPPQRGLSDWESSKEATPAAAGTAAALGRVRIGFSMAKQDRVFARTIAITVGVAIVAWMLISLLEYIQLRRLLRPISTLGDFAAQVGEGDLTRRAPVAGEDEVASVAKALNRMVERLGETTVSKGYVDNIIQSMGESLIVVGGGGKIRMANRATCSLLGYEEEELIGSRADKILGGNDRERTYCAKDGSEIPVLFSEACLRGGEERVWVAQDITERKRVQEQLLKAKDAAEEASRSKSLFLANMSHELRTPLNAIIGYSELLEEIAADNGNGATYADVKKIRSAGLHLLGVINEVLDISKLEAGKVELHAGTFEVGQVVDDVVNTIRPLALKNGNRVEVALDWDGGPLHTDQMKFRQSLLNLLSNACKFTKQGSVKLEIEREEQSDRDWIRVSVRDNGIGIPPEQIGRLFQAFHQVDASNARQHGGTGLGLAITKNFCELMGGSIAVESAPGEGAVFTMRVPSELAKQGVGSRKSEDGSRNETIVSSREWEGRRQKTIGCPTEQ